MNHITFEKAKREKFNIQHVHQMSHCFLSYSDSEITSKPESHVAPISLRLRLKQLMDLF